MWDGYPGPAPIKRFTLESLLQGSIFAQEHYSGRCCILQADVLNKRLLDVLQESIAAVVSIVNHVATSVLLLFLASQDAVIRPLAPIDADEPVGVQRIGVLCSAFADTNIQWFSQSGSIRLVAGATSTLAVNRRAVEHFHKLSTGSIRGIICIFSA